MTARAIRLVVCLVPLLVLNAGVSFASSGPVNVAAGNPPAAAFCPVDSTLTHRHAIKATTRDRLALHCYCCGKDENGHCNHQCCD